MKNIATVKILKEAFEQSILPFYDRVGFEPHPQPDYVNGKYYRDGIEGAYCYDYVKYFSGNVFISAGVSIFSGENSIKFDFYIGKSMEQNLREVDYSSLTWEEVMKILPSTGFKFRGNGTFLIVPHSWKRFNPFGMDLFTIDPKLKTVEERRYAADQLMEKIEQIFDASLMKFIERGVADNHILLDGEFKRFLKTNKPFWIC